MVNIKNPLTVVKGGEPTLITKSITANGAYNASADNADGYSSVSVQTVNKLQKVLARESVTLTADDFDGCSSIVTDQFRGMSGLYGSFDLPSSITSIGTYAFSGCANLALTSLPSGITVVNNGAFNGCTNLALTSLPSGITSINTYAFYNCTNLALTSLPSGITSIGAQAFYNCTNLALTSLPSGITSILNGAFQGCIKLTSITFLGIPTSVGNNAFMGCTNLTQIRVPWSEGEVANAPWGATNASITYNYTGE